MWHNKVQQLRDGSGKAGVVGPYVSLALLLIAAFSAQADRISTCELEPRNQTIVIATQFQAALLQSAMLHSGPGVQHAEFRTAQLLKWLLAVSMPAVQDAAAFSLILAAKSSELLHSHVPSNTAAWVLSIAPTRAP